MSTEAITSDSQNVVAQTQAVTTNQVAVAGSVSTNAPSGGLTTSSTVKDMNDLKKQAPEVYDAMMKGIAQTVCTSMQDHQARLKKMMQDARRDAGS